MKISKYKYVPFVHLV